MDFFTIKDLENLSGIKAHTIRIWEQRYNLLCPRRTDTNIRYYDNDELKRLLNIALLNKYGFKISQINKLNAEQIREKILSLNHSSAQREWHTTQLIDAMVDVDMARFEGLIDNYIREKGVERAITNIIFPFLERIGLLWLTNHINPAQEHLVSNIIRHKLIMGIESVYAKKSIDACVLLFLPENEFHELGLLFINYLLRSRGFDTLYLGASVPLKDAEYVYKKKNIDHIYIHLTAVCNNFNLQSYIRQLIATFGNASVIISGSPACQLKNDHKHIPENIHLIQSFREAVAFINCL